MESAVVERSETAALADTTAPVSVGIVADDLTGANDSAVQFSRRGWSARLVLTDPAGVTTADGSVTAVVTDARAHSAPQAERETRDAVDALAASGIDRVFLKIDSTMRGTVSAQIEGALDAWTLVHPDAIAVVCPAYPAMGRTVDGGRLLVDGAGVETTSVGRDPVTPVTTSVLADLIPSSTSVSAAGRGAAELADLIAGVADDGDRVIVVDAVTDTEVSTIGDAILALGARVVPVGSAGLAVVMASVWGSGASTSAVTPPPPSTGAGGVVVVQVSSLHDVSRAQHAHLAASSTAVHTFAPTLDDVSSTDAATRWIRAELDALNSGVPGAGVPGTGVPGTASGLTAVAVLAPAERGTDPDASERVAAGLATITDAVIAHTAANALVLMGGEGARAVLARLDADAVRVTDAIREGIPIGVVEGGRSHGLTVVTKAGGFGTETSLTEIVPELAAVPLAAVPLDTADHTASPLDARRTP
ncbi:four-carbon acid sugar kinase family protein [Marisediminicola sp. LYQ85]|uniref:four-carbon acid sugar kinase family protein n=1 Tax=Marisediminicola sp. LYQ85 TaxID=3391062 RepID=UPI003982E2C5